MKKKKVMLISKFCPEAVLLKLELEKQHEMNVEWVKTSPEAIQRLTQTVYDLLVLIVDQFTDQQMAIAKGFRGLGYEYPLIILAKTITKGTQKLVAKMPQTVLLETPHSQIEFGGCLTKMLQGEMVKQRYFRRFMTNQPSNVEVLKDNTHIEGKVKNLSLGGAFFEYTHVYLRKGDLVRVKFELKEIHRKYDMLARVMWITERSPWGGGRGAGLMFLQAAEVPARASV